MPHPSHSPLERSRLWLKITGLTAAITLHAGAFAFLLNSAEPKMMGEPALEEIVGVSLIDLNELEDLQAAEEQADTLTPETMLEEPEVEPEPEVEIEPEPEPEPEPVVDEPVIPEPVVEKPKPRPQPKPKPVVESKPKSEVKVAEKAQPAAAPTPAKVAEPVGGQKAKATQPDQPRLIGQLNYLGQPPKPVYPRASQRRNEQGKVIVRVLITTQGTVGDVWLQRSSGHERLDKAALTAVRNVKFKPYTENGVAFRAMADIPFDFYL